MAAECDPRDAGLDRDAVEAIWRSVVRLYRTGLHPAIALCLRRRGRIVLERAIGHLRGNAPDDPPDGPKVPIRYDSLFNLFSASKAVTAMLVHLLDERGLLHIDDAVVEYIPEFGRHGKDAITIKQILTHRAGIPTLRNVPAHVDLLCDRERLLQHLYEAPTIFPPGRRLSYHALTGGFVLDEIFRRVTGKNARELLSAEILAPLKFRTFNYGVEPSRLPDVAVNAFTGLPPWPPYSWMIERVLGVGAREAVAISNDPRFLTAIVPSGNVIGTAEEGCRFFELLLRHGKLDGRRIFEGRTVRRAVAEASYLQIDSFLGLPVRYSAGFMLGHDWISVYGFHTPRAFGHVGFSNVVAWADPERDLSACLMTSGKPFITPGQALFWNVMRTIAARVPRVPAGVVELARRRAA